MISNISSKNNIGSGIFHSSDITLVNLFRRAILQEIETYAIEYAVFDVNQSPLHDEKIALKLGQLVIDYNRFEELGLHLDLDKRYNIDVTGVKDPLLSEFRGYPVTSDDIKGLPIKSLTTSAIELVRLDDGKRLKCSVIVRKNTGTEHVKWRPVGLVEIKEIQDGFFVSRLNVNNQIKIENNETHYIDSVIVYQNTTNIKDEFLATEIATKIQIDYSKFTSDAEMFEITIDKTGPTNLINRMDKFIVPFKFHFDIANLSEGQTITCKITIKKGKRDNYIRWKSAEYDYPDVSGYQFKFYNIGMLTTEQIFEKGFEKIRTAALKEPITFFSKVRIPKVIPDEIPI